MSDLSCRAAAHGSSLCHQFLQYFKNFGSCLFNRLCIWVDLVSHFVMGKKHWQKS